MPRFRKQEAHESDQPIGTKGLKVSPSLRLPAFSEPLPALGAAGGRPAPLLPAHLTRERQRPRHQLQGLPEPHQRGGQDPSARRQVWGVQRGHGEPPNPNPLTPEP